MSIPLKYNLRNLRVRWRLTLATSFGVALVVAVYVMVTALAQGMQATYVSTGDPRNLLVMRKGSTAESSSQIVREDARRIRYAAGIARDDKGDPMTSAEIVVLIFLQRIDGTGGANVLVRGMGRMGFELRPAEHLVAGRMFQPGMRECVVSRKIAERFAHCGVGEQFSTGKTLWTVVGIFDAARTAYDSEIWADADETRDVFRRDFYGSVLLRPAADEAAQGLIRRLQADRNIQVDVRRETDYYAEQTKSATPIQFIAGLLATIMSIGAAFSAMNTMYATVGARTREIGTLRVLGFRRREIYLSFLFESVMLSMLGGVIGCLLALPLNGIATGTFSPTSFAEIAFEFRITPALLGRGMVFALAMGLIGGLLPARRAALRPLLDALKAA